MFGGEMTYVSSGRDLRPCGRKLDHGSGSGVVIELRSWADIQRRAERRKDRNDDSDAGSTGSIADPVSVSRPPAHMSGCTAPIP